MEFQDETLVCKDCGKEFIFTVGEQEFYAEKGFEHKPVRCRNCRDKKSMGATMSDRCSPAFVLSAGRKLKCLLSQRTTERFIAAIALRFIEGQCKIRRRSRVSFSVFSSFFCIKSLLFGTVSYII